MTRPTILFIDDQTAARELFARTLDLSRYQPALAPGVVAAEGYLHGHRVDVIVTDLRMPDVDGLEGLERLHAIDPEVPIVLMTAFGTVETAVQAMKRGAFDYLSKPFDPDELALVIERALQHRGLLRENRQLRSQVARQAPSPELVCRDPAMQAALRLVERVAPSDAAVLLCGESGTGKDVMAQQLHRQSHRANGPFVSLNCSAIPEHLLESELFGHEKGAFSGASTARDGFFCEADGGTLFLDEIGDLGLGLQPKLLRVLQDGEFYRVGSRRLQHTDVRLVCASNRALEKLVEDGSFRQDLYYRINTVRIELPPLRQRPQDIAPLCELFLGRLRARDPRAPLRLTAAALQALQGYPWPGNVRELQHAIERAALVAEGDAITPECLPGELLGRPGPLRQADDAPYKDARRTFETDYFSRLLTRAHHNVHRAADLAGLHRSTLYEKLAALGLPFDGDHGGPREKRFERA